MTRLAAKHLAKNYNNRAVVDDVSIHVNTGEMVGLLGPNGAGKTTSFYMMVGLVKMDSGTILLGDQDITHHPMHVRAQLGLGYLPQESSVFRKLTVADNLRAVLQLRADLTEGQIELTIEDLLQEFHISHLYSNNAMSLSGGERRRVEIARALATDPQFILLDEPFAGVDPLSIKDIKEVISHLCQRGIGILITEHNVKETLGSCDRAYILNEGKVMAEGNAQEILDHDEVRNVYLGHDFTM